MVKGGSNLHDSQITFGAHSSNKSQPSVYITNSVQKPNIRDKLEQPVGSIEQQ